MTYGAWDCVRLGTVGQRPAMDAAGLLKWLFPAQVGDAAP